MAAFLKLEYGKNKYVYPAFKFMKAVHARLLLENGQVHLPTLREFRDETKHSGLIHDRGEGRITLANHYTRFRGCAKFADGLLAKKFKPYEVLNVNGFDLTEELEAPDCCIFCLTRYFFSDTLDWAIQDGKDACVLITDVDEVVKQISAAVVDQGLAFVDLGNCNYVVDQYQRVLEVDPRHDTYSNVLLTNPSIIAFSKQRKYEAQREIRAAWKRTGEGDATPITIDIPSIKQFLIPVNFAEIDKTLLLSQHREEVCVGVRIVRKSGEPPATLEIQEPRHLCSPMIYQPKEGEWKLGFIYAQGKVTDFLSSYHFGGSVGVAFTMTDLHVFLATVPLDDVARIEFYHSEGEHQFANATSEFQVPSV